MLNDVEFREVTDLVKVDKVKIVACDGKSKILLFLDKTYLHFISLVIKLLVIDNGFVFVVMERLLIITICI